VKRHAAVGLALALVAVTATAADPRRPPDPPAASGGVLELIDAVRLTLAHDPNIRLQETTADFLAGVLEEQAGAFDLGLTSDVSYQFGQQGLTDSTREDEQQRRDDLQTEIDDFAEQGDALAVELAELEALQSDPAGFELSDPVLQAQVNLINLLIERSDDPSRQAQFTQLRDDSIADEIAIVSSDLAEVRDDEADSREDLALLGEVPSGQEDYFFDYELELAKPLRSGQTLTAFTDFEVDGENYIGKAKDADLGGTGVIDFYDATVGFRVDLPLGEGRGRVSAAAGESAARIDWEASLATLRHVAAQRVLLTVQSYWALAAAQRRLAALEESLAINVRLVEIVQALIDAGQVAGAEIARALASEADARGQLAAARADLHAARVALTVATGLEIVDGHRLPAAVDGFPEAADLAPIDDLPTPAWQRAALVRRDDLEAALRLEASGKVLHQAARRDLLPQVDLELEVSARSILESSSVGQGVAEVLAGKWVTPSGSLAATVDWAFANRAGRGLEQQSAALRELRAISARDLERTIRADVVLAMENLRYAAEEMRLASEAVAQYRQVLDAEVDRLRYGTSTVIDALLTEQRLTAARLAEITAQQTYWQLLAELRFATGTLVGHADGGARVEARSLLTCPLGGEEAPR
jgi:outer membrane protein TolC